MSNVWPSLRQWIAIVLIVAVIFGVRVLWPYLTPLSLSLLLTFVLIPSVHRVEGNTGWPRAGATAFVYLLLLIAIVLVPALVIPALVNQAQTLTPTLERGVASLGSLIEELGTTTILGQQVDPYQLYLQFSEQLASIGAGIASSSVNAVFGIATGFLSTVAWLFFILIISFYIVLDWPNISHYLWGLTPREARPDIYYLTRRIDRTWHAFLRGQLILSTVIFVSTTTALLILGVPQPLFLGFLAGLLNLIPNLGPVLSAVPAIILALMQGSTHFEISNILFAIIVAGAYTLIQQLESNFLVPRIIGGSVNLHPAVVLLGAIIGFSTIGILGIFLAAPTLASLRVVAGYAYRKVLDPDFRPAGVQLPPEIAAIPDPRERPLGLKPPLTPAVPPRSWRQWFTRTNNHQPTVPSEERHDA